MNLHYLSERNNCGKYLYNPLEQWVLCYKNGEGYFDNDDSLVEKMRKVICDRENSEIVYVGMVNMSLNSIDPIIAVWKAYCQTGKFFNEKVKFLVDNINCLLKNK